MHNSRITPPAPLFVICYLLFIKVFFWRERGKGEFERAKILDCLIFLGRERGKGEYKRVKILLDWR